MTAKKRPMRPTKATIGNLPSGKVVDFHLTPLRNGLTSVGLRCQWIANNEREWQRINKSVYQPAIEASCRGKVTVDTAGFLADCYVTQVERIYGHFSVTVEVQVVGASTLTPKAQRAAARQRWPMRKEKP